MVAGATLGDLRHALAAGSAEIVALGRDEDERSDLGHELRKIDQELAAAEPDGAAVTTRWRSVLKVLDGVVATGTTVAGITELIGKIFGV